MRKPLLITAILVALGLAPASASALAPPTPWDGSNPFNCTIQSAGFGTTVPDPGADPYCVQFDKTNQNLTQLGIVGFLLKEPARVAAASPKCFYFQEDHWRGSISQSDPVPLYEFIGHYFFNKATGDGGAWVTDFTVAGQTFDPTTLPGFPPSWGQFFGPGTGGMITDDDIPIDPRCAALARRDPAAVYRHAANAPRCVPDTGHIDRHGVGPVSLGARENAIRSELGPPQDVERGFLSYCVEGGGLLLVGEPGDRSGTLGGGGRDPAVLAITTSRGFVAPGVRDRLISVGSPAAALPRSRRVGMVHGLAVLRRGNLIAGVRHHRIAFLGAYSTSAIRSPRALLRKLRHAP